MAEKIVKDSQGLVNDLVNNLVNDTISRQAAIDVINESNSPIAEYLIGEIMALSSAQPERKRGKWVFYEDRAPVWDIAGEKTWARAYKCSECSFVHSVIEDFGQYAFCPNCGADMREDEQK